MSSMESLGEVGVSTRLGAKWYGFVEEYKKKIR